MKSPVDVCRESSSKSCKTAHIGGCIAAIAVMAVLAIAKLGGYPPASMNAFRLMLFPFIAYGFVAAGMLWTLGRSIKRAKITDESAPMAADVPQSLSVML
jgi:hypothetical protein